MAENEPETPFPTLIVRGKGSSFEDEKSVTHPVASAAETLFPSITLSNLLSRRRSTEPEGWMVKPNITSYMHGHERGTALIQSQGGPTRPGFPTNTQLRGGLLRPILLPNRPLLIRGPARRRSSSTSYQQQQQQLQQRTPQSESVVVRNPSVLQKRRSSMDAMVVSASLPKQPKLKSALTPGDRVADSTQQNNSDNLSVKLPNGGLTLSMVSHSSDPMPSPPLRPLVVAPGVHSGGSFSSQNSSSPVSPAIMGLDWQTVAARLAKRGMTLTLTSPAPLPLTPPTNNVLSPISNSTSSPRGSPRIPVNTVIQRVPSVGSPVFGHLDPPRPRGNPTPLNPQLVQQVRGTMIPMSQDHTNHPRTSDETEKFLIPVIGGLDLRKLRTLTDIGVVKFIPLQEIPKLGIPIIRLRQDISLGHFPHDAALEIGPIRMMAQPGGSTNNALIRSTSPGNATTTCRQPPPLAPLVHTQSVSSPPVDGTIRTNRKCPELIPIGAIDHSANVANSIAGHIGVPLQSPPPTNNNTHLRQPRRTSRRSSSPAREFLELGDLIITRIN